jgi:hypothetical protein
VIPSEIVLPSCTLGSDPWELLRLLLFLTLVARGISTVGTTEAEAIQSVLDGNPELEIVACERIDLSDIPLQTPVETPHWVVVFEDADPSKFVQDADPIAKVTAEVRHSYELMASDPHSMPTAVIEGPFTCPSCLAEVNLTLPPDGAQRRFPPGAKVFAECPECGTKLFRRRGAARDEWQRDDRLKSDFSRIEEPQPPGQGLGERRACIFCGVEDRKISKEHLWSKWIREHVEASSGATSSRLHVKDRIKIAKRDEIPIGGFDREIAGPCKPCNETWMSELEGEVAPILIPMLHNETVELRPEEQRTVARWATLKLLVAQELHPSLERIIDPSRYRQFYVDRSLPTGAQVWLGRYSGAGPWPTNYRFQALFMTMHGEDEAHCRMRIWLGSRSAIWPLSIGGTRSATERSRIQARSTGT